MSAHAIEEVVTFNHGPQGRNGGAYVKIGGLWYRLEQLYDDEAEEAEYWARKAKGEQS